MILCPVTLDIPNSRHRAAIFSPSRNRDTNLSDPHLGLGLYIARLIAEFHGGRIAAANRDDGSVVIVTLRFPLRAADG